MSEEVKDFLKLVKPSMKRRLRELLIKYSEPSDLICDALKKVTIGFNSESVEKIKTLREEIETDLKNCENQFLEIALIQSRSTLEFAKCESEVNINTYIQILDLCKSITNKLIFQIESLRQEQAYASKVLDSFEKSSLE